MAEPCPQVERLRVEAASSPSVERFLRTYEAVNASLGALARTLSTVGTGAPGELRERVAALDELRRREAQRIWSIDLPPDAKSALQILLLRQSMALDRLRTALGPGAR